MEPRHHLGESRSFLSLVFLSSDIGVAACLYVGVWVIAQLGYAWHECGNVLRLPGFGFAGQMSPHSVR